MFQKRVVISVIGLDQSGKSSILSSICNTNHEPQTPTIGMAVKRFKRNNLQFICLDMSGQAPCRVMWPIAIKDSMGIIYVIDSGDINRISIVRQELLILFSTKINIPILFFANKQDLESSMSITEISNYLSLKDLTQNWNIIPCSSTSREDIENGIKWMRMELQQGF